MIITKDGKVGIGYGNGRYIHDRPTRENWVCSATSTTPVISPRTVLSMPNFRTSRRGARPDGSDAGNVVILNPERNNEVMGPTGV